MAAAISRPARWIGEDPLEPFGPRAFDQVREVDGYRTVADLMINSRYDPELEEVSAFEDQVSSHGGLGGPQTHPFLLYPAELDRAGRADLHLAGDVPRTEGLARRTRPSGGRRSRVAESARRSVGAGRQIRTLSRRLSGSLRCRP